MSVLVYAESNDGKLKKVALEAASYAKKVADMLQTTVTAVTVNANDTDVLGNYGVSKVLKVNASWNDFNANAVAKILQQAAVKENSSVVILPGTTDAMYLAPIATVALQASFASNVVALPESTTPFVVKRTAFSNKAFNFTQLDAAVKVLCIAKNAFGLHEDAVAISTEDFSVEVSASYLGVKVQNVEKTTGKVTIADAEVVVSGGRGLKGPENWGMLEELAQTLGAATACSKPVSDLGWRPHSEHVGQTGKPVATNLYIAIGISGAIQHIAGINSSKVKVVINSDPEAPFFKVADYGIVGDAFDIVPRLTQKIKEFKMQSA
ncbi:MAG: electron transfer flavoprotein subunit alpha/FixB family protein [Flavobacterium sp.]